MDDVAAYVVFFGMGVSEDPIGFGSCAWVCVLGRAGRGDLFVGGGRWDGDLRVKGLRASLERRKTNHHL